MRIKFTEHKRLFQEVFGSEAGKKVLHDILNRCHMTDPTIRAGDAQEQYLVREGKRQVALYILKQINYDIDEYLNERAKYKMEVEHD